jgi:glycosyltransferase involved in cell wall biosynthesis
MSLSILQIIRSLDPATGGPAEYVKLVSEQLQRDGCRVKIVTLDPTGSQWLNELPVSVVGCGPVQGTYGYRWKLQADITKEAAGFDRIIIHGLWQFHGFCSAAAARQLGTRYFLFPHGMLDPWFRKAFPVKHFKKQLYWIVAERGILTRAQAVLFTSRSELERAATTFWPGGRYHGEVVPLGTKNRVSDLARSRELFLKTFPQLKRQPFLIFLGRIHPKKGCDLLVQAMDLLRWPLGLAVAGPAPDLQHMRWLLQSTTGKPVIFTGALDGDLRAGALASASALILPSHQENFGMVVAEALMFGLPVLISNRVGIAEFVGPAGFVEPDNLEGAVNLIRRYLSADRDAMGKAALECFANHFDIQIASKRLLDLLR